MSGLGPLAAPDPYRYRAIWGIPVNSRRAFDLLVARQLIWLPHAKLAVRRLLFTDDEQPLCPACGEVVTTGTPSVVCVALLADRDLEEELARDPAAFAGRNPDSLEAWWLLHGTCFDGLTQARVGELDQRIELALRADARVN
jgi:hypothetical protein